MEVAEKLDFREFRGKDPNGWGYEYRRKMFNAACKYLGIHKTDVSNGVSIGFHSFSNSDHVDLTGSILEKVKRDDSIVSNERRIIDKIKNHRDYKINDINEFYYFGSQLGGQRNTTDMWKQALGFWHWSGQYSATWDVAFNELTWTVRTTQVTCNYLVSINGKMTLKYSFDDKLDLRPDWNYKSLEYNAICVVLGFLYHDALGCSDEMRVKAKWTTIVNG